jgi:hypothetical protein
MKKKEDSYLLNSNLYVVLDIKFAPETARSTTTVTVCTASVVMEILLMRILLYNNIINENNTMRD